MSTNRRVIVVLGFSAALLAAGASSGQNRYLIPADSLVRGQNVAVGAAACGGGAYGAKVLLNKPPCTSVPNVAEYEFTVGVGGTYRLSAQYAAAESRAVTIVINGSVAKTNAMGSATGCWEESCQRWFRQGLVELRAGLNTLRIERHSYFPHIKAFRFRVYRSPAETDAD